MVNIYFNNIYKCLYNLELFEDDYKTLFKRIIYFIFYKKKCKKIREDIVSKLQSLKKDKWDSHYLYDLQYTLFVYLPDLKKYLNGKIDILEDIDDISFKFIPLCFHLNTGYNVTMKVISDNITLIQENEEEKYSFSYSYEVDEYLDIVQQCKQLLVDVLIARVYGGKSDEPV